MWLSQYRSRVVAWTFVCVKPIMENKVVLRASGYVKYNFGVYSCTDRFFRDSERQCVNFPNSRDQSLVSC